MPLESPALAHSVEPAFDDRILLTDAARRLAGAGDFRAALEQTLQACLPALGDFGFFDARDGDHVVRVARAHEDPRIDAILRPTRWVRQDRDDLNLCALSSGRAALHATIDDAWYRRVAANEAHLAILRELDFRSMITVPMHFRGELIGSLTLFMGRSRRAHGSAHLGSASDIAAIAAPVVANARLLDQQRAAAEALRIAEERLELAQQAAGLGTWDWYVATNEVYWSPRYREIYGLAPDQPATFEAGMGTLSLEDRDRVADAMARALQSKLEFRSLHQVHHPHRGARWVEAIGKATYDARGLPVRVTGVVADVTERHLATEEMRNLRDLLGAELEAQRRLHALTLSTARRDRDLAALLREILVATLDITNRDLGAFHLFDAEAGVLRLAVAHGFDARFEAMLREVQPGTALPSAMAARLRERVVIEDVATELARSPRLADLLAAGVRAAQSTPLLGRDGELIGTLTTHSRFVGRPSDRELRLLDMLCRTSADLVEWGRKP